MNKEEILNNDKIIRQIEKILKEESESQLMIVFKGRSFPATYAESAIMTIKDIEYMTLSFWDGDSGNMFDVDYRLLPERIFINGVEIKY